MFSLSKVKTLFKHVRIAQQNKVTVTIEKPIQEVFSFTTDPKQTPKWISSIKVEQIDTPSPAVGTIYKNQDNSGQWSTYKVTKYIPNREFELAKQDESTYFVNYTYSTCPNGATKLVYHEWVTKGKINDPFTQDVLNQLKARLENPNPTVTVTEKNNEEKITKSSPI